jgi:hypothetical protein
VIQGKEKFVGLVEVDLSQGIVWGGRESSEVADGGKFGIGDDWDYGVGGAVWGSCGGVCDGGGGGCKVGRRVGVAGRR